MQNQDIEKNVIDSLLNNGMSYEIPKRGLLRLLSKNKNWKVTIRQPYLGTLDTLCGLYLSMELDEDKLKENANNESKQLIKRSALKAAKVVAVSMLNNKWLIRLFANALAKRLMWRIRPSELFQLVMIINALNNAVDFTSSIRLMQGVRTSEPKANLIEEKKQV